MKRVRFDEMDVDGSAVFKIVHDYLNPQSSNTVGAPWESTHIRPADFRQRLATGHHAILLGVLQSCVNTLPVLDKAPFLITICQKDNQTGVPNYTKWTQLLTAEKSGKVFGAQSYNGSSGHAFWLAQQFGSQPHYVGQWKFELFYSNVWAMFSDTILATSDIGGQTTLHINLRLVKSGPARRRMVINFSPKIRWQMSRSFSR